MDKLSVLSSPFFNDDKIFENVTNWGILARSTAATAPVSYSLAEVGGKDFSVYMERFDLPLESNVLVLDPNQHYYYDKRDLKGVRLLVNIKKLNLVKDLNILLRTLCRVMPLNAGLMGCFSDSSSDITAGLLPVMLGRLKRYIEPWSGHSLDRKSVSQLLEKSGFMITDFTEINGLTYFHAYKTCQPF
ncbi:MAG: hypothetical protein K0B05_14285 [Bacteroidales bacterium]|nr:hypothetical protein [Bacteroidales bacterium]